jgi:predicted nucleotidyltransferase
VIEELIQKIAQGLDEEKIPYMIIGGQAVLLYGTPRLTRDIDITLGVDTDMFLPIEKLCRQLGLKTLPENPEDFARDTKVLPAEEPESRIRVDFIFSFTPYEAQAIKRTKQVLMGDYPVKFASCEDVIIHKMIAARAVDVEDVRNILIKHKDSADLEYIKQWLSEFSKIPEHKEILEKFNVLLEQK